MKDACKPDVTRRVRKLYTWRYATFTIGGHGALEAVIGGRLKATLVTFLEPKKKSWTKTLSPRSEQFSAINHHALQLGRHGNGGTYFGIS